MSTKIWKVQFKENIDRFDVVAKTAAEAVEVAVKLFQTQVNEDVKEAQAENRPKNEVTRWTWYTNHGYTEPELVELIAESDN